MAKNKGAAWGAISRTSPIMVSFSILTAIKMTSSYISSGIITPHFRKNKRGNSFFAFSQQFPVLSREKQ
jgi:hypothetical protein